MKKLFYVLLLATSGWTTVIAQDSDETQHGFSFSKNGHILVATSPDGHVQRVDLSNPAFKGKAVAFTYSAKKKPVYQKPDKSVSSVRIFPNPASGAANLSLDGEWSFPVNARLFDKTGNLIKISTLETREAVMDISRFQPGMYVLDVQASTAHAVQKLLIQ